MNQTPAAKAAAWRPILKKGDSLICSYDDVEGGFLDDMFVEERALSR